MAYTRYDAHKCHMSRSRLVFVCTVWVFALADVDDDATCRHRTHFVIIKLHIGLYLSVMSVVSWLYVYMVRILLVHPSLSIVNMFWPFVSTVSWLAQEVQP